MDLPNKSSRIQSLDALRGLVMIIMALDHTRDFLHYDAFIHDPLNLLYSPGDLFLTRWITHFCAPTFIFLTGTSAYLYGLKHTKSELSKFLFTRGLWLIFLELTVINFGWLFSWAKYTPILMVICAIGASMIFLALMVHFPRIILLIVGLAILLLHNTTDNIHFAPGTILNNIWTLLHVQGVIQFTEQIKIFVFYPILPYLGLICLGYCFGRLYDPKISSEKRKNALLVISSSAIILFIIIRFTNTYGDSRHWEHQVALRYTILSFLNCTKYPVSLLFALMTIGPSILFLYFFDSVRNWFVNILTIYGKAPMFYYIIHIYLIHTIAFLTETPDSNTPFHLHNRFHLWAVYLIWIGIVTLLYFPCRWYGTYKSAHPEKWWLSYL